MSRTQVIDSIQALLPQSEAVEAVVLLQERTRWALPAAMITFFVSVNLLILAGANPILAYALGGGALGGIVALGSSPWLLVRTSTRRLLFRSSKLRPRAISLEAEMPEGSSLRHIRSMILYDVYELVGKKVTASRGLRNRLASIMAIETA